MKSLLIFAIVALAANAHLSTPAYHLGFSEQLGLNSQQLQHASTCFNSFKQVLADIHSVSESKHNGFAAVLRSLLTTVEDVENKLKVDCGIYLQELAMTILRKTNGDIKGTLLRNFDRYTAQIIQQIALYMDALVGGNHYHAGQIEAYILQILFGIEQPKTVEMPQFNMSRYVPMNISKYVYELNEGYLKTLGFADSQVINNTAACTLEYVNFVTAVQMFSYNLSNAQNVEEKIRLIEKLVLNGFRVYESCSSAFKFNWEHISKPILMAFKNAPVHTTVALIHNIAVNLPELQQTHIEMVMSIFEGQYYKAGRLSAEELMVLVKNFWF